MNFVSIVMALYFIDVSTGVNTHVGITANIN